MTVFYFRLTNTTKAYRPGIPSCRSRGEGGPEAKATRRPRSRRILRSLSAFLSISHARALSQSLSLALALSLSLSLALSLCLSLSLSLSLSLFALLCLGLGAGAVLCLSLALSPPLSLSLSLSFARVCCGKLPRHRARVRPRPPFGALPGWGFRCSRQTGRKAPRMVTFLPDPLTPQKLTCMYVCMYVCLHVYIIYIYIY